VRTFGTIVLVLMLLLGGSFALYKVNYPTYTYRFRLSIAVDVGGETKTAASVIEVEAVMRPMPIIFSLVNLYVHGDAVFLDLGNGRNSSPYSPAIRTGRKATSKTWYQMNSALLSSRTSQSLRHCAAVAN
jgi:hypothetical protein